MSDSPSKKDLHKPALRMFSSRRAAASVVIVALVLVPAPLLPPLPLAGAVQSTFGIGWKAAYFVSAIFLHVALYGSLGIIAAFAVKAATGRQRWLQLAWLPVVVILIVVAIRSIRLRHVPMLTNAIVPIGACGLGVLLGVFFRQHGWRATFVATFLFLGGVLWAYWPTASSALSRSTEGRLRQLVASRPRLIASGDQRFGVLLRAAFHTDVDVASSGAVEHNRAAILALGIAIGHERLARYVGLKRDSELVRDAAALRAGTTLREREDWARHFCLSAALAVVENPFLSDAGGLIKEELDALTHGSGFSFGDLAADRAGVRFARAATRSESAAQAVRGRLQTSFASHDFLPPTSDLSENLTPEQFRREYGGVGSTRYRQVVSQIEARLDRCAAFSPDLSSQ